MYELLLIACLNSTACELVQSPVIYRTEERCAISASMLAGMMKGRHANDARHSYLFQCSPLAGGDAEWVVVDAGGAQAAAEPGSPTGAVQD